MILEPLPTTYFVMVLIGCFIPFSVLLLRINRWRVSLRSLLLALTWCAIAAAAAGHEVRTAEASRLLVSLCGVFAGLAPSLVIVRLLRRTQSRIASEKLTLQLTFWIWLLAFLALTGVAVYGVYTDLGLAGPSPLLAPPGHMLPYSHYGRPHGPDARVQRITANLLGRFSG